MTQNIPETPAPFGAFRRLFWPIYSYELKKFLPLAGMMFFILFNYTILRNIKDTIVITGSGAEALPFIKGTIVLPVSILVVALYAKFSNTLSRESLFYATIGTFLGFFVLYAVYLYPNRDVLHFSAEKLAYLKATYPNFQHIFPMIGSWTEGAFYLFAELWGSVILSLLFWQFANEITRLGEAKRFYSMFGFLGHFALILAGEVGDQLCTMQLSVENSDLGFTSVLNTIIAMIIAAGFCTIALYYWMTNYVITDERYYDGAKVVHTPKEPHPKMSLKKSFLYIVNSKYLGYIMVMVLGYGLCSTVIGLLWKKQVHLQYPSALEYAKFMSQYSYWLGVTTILMTFLLKGVVERFGWFKGAMITPIILLLTSIPFFMFILFEEWTTPMVSWMHLTPLLTAVIIGAAQQIMSKGAKYSMFDPTKEMAYIPLDQELKVKGKAAIDVSGYSFSKACGGYLSAGLLILFAASDMMVIAPYMAFIVFGMIIFWIHAVKQLSKLYYRKVNTEKP